jgi:class 3 adenylate cyclase
MKSWSPLPPSASHAVECAIAIQRSLASHNKSHPDTQINVRIGICAGEPVEETSDCSVPQYN